jgi:hypothetical protein
MSYHTDDKGSYEVFYLYPTDLDALHADGAMEDIYEPGWYWWACWPGCLPDGDPCGPFATEQEAVDDATGEPE